LWDLRKGSGSGSTLGSGSSVKLLGAGGLFQHALLSSIDLVAPCAAAQQRMMASVLRAGGDVAAGGRGASSVQLLRPSLVQRVVANPCDTSLLALVMQVHLIGPVGDLSTVL
jgi:hypothetical protein